MLTEQMQMLPEALLALIPTPPPTRYYRIDRDGYLLAVGVGLGGTEIGEGEYAAIAAVIGDRPTPPAGYDYRLRSDLTWELWELQEPEETELDPAEALELICGSSRLTRTQASAYRSELVKSGALAEKPDPEIKETREP